MVTRHSQRPTKMPNASRQTASVPGMGRRAAGTLAAALLLASAAAAWHRYAAGPRPATATGVACWSWQTRLPSQEDVDRARALAGMRALFARAGQLDGDGARLSRVRPASGRFPSGVELHLVYNSTGRLLDALETLDAEAFAALVRDTFVEDGARAARDGAAVAGLQLDLDVPTRLLGRYRDLLAAVRRALPEGTALSITGLPTWMGSPDLGDAVDEVDFWVPQFYGAEVPRRAGLSVPIASAGRVARDVERARALGRPFYAGLAAYGYAARYARDGSLVELRGDMDPATVARVDRLELVERRPFDDGPSAWRYHYRAKADCLADGLALRAGESLVLDVPTGELLRACARAARERGGERLLGLCVFRLPSRSDATALSVEEVAAALADAPAALEADVAAERVAGSRGGTAVRVRAVNTGSAAALVGDGAVSLEVGVPPGGVVAVRRGGPSRVEFLGSGTAASPRRASSVRASAAAWGPGRRIEAEVEVPGELPARLPVTLTARAPDGSVWRAERLVEVR